jgi:phenylacetate-coenzyme A ligase PaaK-like adenylate-forming protein
LFWAGAICQLFVPHYIAVMLATAEIIREAAQPERVRELLPRWQSVPLYRETLATAGRNWAQLPAITKQEMRTNFPQNFLGPNQSLEQLLAAQHIELEYTSGTSEERLPVIFGRGWWNEQEERALRLNRFVASVLDANPQARRATLTAPACNGLTCPTIWMSQAQRTIGSSLFVNLARIPFVLSDAELQRMADEITGWAPQFLDLDPVHGVWFALFCKRHGIRFPSLRFVICSYEFVSVVHRRIIERVFGVPVFNLYGSTETGHLLMENETGAMKPSLDTAMLEVVAMEAAIEAFNHSKTPDLIPSPRPSGERVRERGFEPEPIVPPLHEWSANHDSEKSLPRPLLPSRKRREQQTFEAAGIGPLLVTTLSNHYMPLLRYRIGDLVQRHERSYGTDYTVHGRIRDALTAADGTRVTTWQVDQCFAEVKGIVHYQLRQTTPTDFQLRYIPEPNGVNQDALTALTPKLAALLGASVRVESVPTLLPEASGKFRLTCHTAS